MTSGARTPASGSAQAADAGVLLGPPEVARVLDRMAHQIIENVARTDFDAALKINPRLTSSLYGRGLAKQRNGSISEGNLDIANAKAMDPNIVQEFEGYGVR